MSFQPQSPPVDLAQIIERLERRRLDNVHPPAMPIWGQLEHVPFVRVLGQARFWQADPALDYAQCGRDFVVGVHGQGSTLLYLIVGEQRSIKVLVGLQIAQGDPLPLLQSSLRAAFPGIELSDQAVTALGSTLNQQHYFAHLGRLTGIPTCKTGAAPGQRSDEPADFMSGQQIERLLRGLYGERWGYLVRATLVDDAQVSQLAYQGLERITQVSSLVRWQVNEQEQATTTKTRSTSYDQTNRQAQYAVDLLECQLERLNSGKALGMWQVDGHFFAADPITLGKARALLRAIFAGKDSTPQPLRTFVCQQESSEDPQAFGALLNSNELATLTALPRDEFPGYRVGDYARFDTDPLPAPASPQTAINVGKILDGGRETGNWFVVERADFAKHGLVVGVTGSGKTNTIFYLLDRLWQGGRGVPFLVIEPAKSEYRDLMTVPGLEKLRVYTLGDETVAPLRLNPFEFEIAAPERRVHVQTHIDYLKSVFNAAFILYAPMPYVLETCLHQIYQDKGWDLTSGRNRRLPAQEHGREAHWPVFPTLSDLYYKIDQVVEGLGYEERIKMDVKAGLQTRIGSLLLGGKGLMLDTARGVPLADLLTQPTVLELERIGNDDEKAFLIGLVLTRLYEYRRVQAMSGDDLPPLQHMAVFEEAHRLLKNVPTEIETEGANVKGQAVETFANMLSEIRAYGQGVLIAEQIPIKLAPDAIKNTNLKVLQRIVAADDREVMGGAMNLDEAQGRVVAALPTGRAVVYAEGADSPYLVQIVRHRGKREDQRRLTDAQVAQAMAPLTQTQLYDPAPGYSRFISRVEGHFDSLVRDRALAVMAQADFAETWNCYVLSALLEAESAAQNYHRLLALAGRAVRELKPQEEQQMMLALLLHAAEAHFATRGRDYAWFYNVVAHLQNQFTDAVVKIVREFKNDQATLSRLSAQIAGDLSGFCSGYVQQTSKAPPPYAGCVHCSERCLYRYEVALIARDQALERDFVAAIRDSADDDAMWHSLARVSWDAAGRVLAVSEQDKLKGAALCYAVQMSARLNFSSASQKKMGRNVKTVLER